MQTLNEWLHYIGQASRDEAASTWPALADWLEERADPRAELVRVLYQPGFTATVEERNSRLRALLDVVPPLWENTLGMHFVWVPPGTFWMGGGGGKCGEKQETIKAGFAMGVFAVTQGQWQAVMGENPSYFSRTGDGKKVVKDITYEELKQFPVEMVSWNDVQKFIKKLNSREQGCVYRLPSEVEWEYACRGGAMTKEECSYNFYCEKPTNDLSSIQANFDGNYPCGTEGMGPFLKRPTKVGSYAPNKLGLYDMHGNVWEWTSSQEGSGRVSRGGSWDYDGGFFRASSRGRRDPVLRRRILGFRLACSSVQ